MNGASLAILGTRGIPARYGGFETFAEELSRGLSDCGIAVTVFCEAADESEGPEYYGRVSLRYVKAPACGPLRTVVFDIRCLWLARKDYDVVYMLGYGASAFCFLPRLWGKRVWINVDGLEWARAKWGLLARLYLRTMEVVAMFTPSRIIADADGIRDYLASRYHRMPACSVIPYGCRIATSAPSQTLLAEWGLLPEEYYVVVCRLEPENHVLEILQGFQRSSSVRKLIVIGDYKVENKYINKLMAIPDPRIQFLGAQYDRQKLYALRYYAAGYFHGHSVGGTNPSLLEAMGCGSLVIAHDNCFNREVLGTNGFFFHDLGQITEHIFNIENVELNIDLFKNGALQRAKEVYNWPRIITAYEQLIHSELAAM